MATSKRAAGFIVGAVVAAAAAIGAHYEGMRTSTYHDVAGIPTICYGHTHGVHDGDTATPEQCHEWLQKEMADANAIVRRCIHVPLTMGQEVAFTDAVYNAGSAIVCGSTLQRMANAGDLEGACRQLPRWVYAKGKVIAGLVKRRHTEMQICLGKKVTS